MRAPLSRYRQGAPSVNRARVRCGMSDAEREHERDAEHQVTPLELFFDLVLVFAITQVTSLLAHNPTWGGVLRGMLVLAALWWAWTTYAWLTSAMDVDDGGIRLALLTSAARSQRTRPPRRAAPVRADGDPGLV